MADIGNIMTVRGQVVEVSFSDDKNRPARHDILEVVDSPNVLLEAIIHVTQPSRGY